MHVLALKPTTIHSFQMAQIAVLEQDKALTEIPAEYADYTNIFSFKLAMELSKNIGINKHAIEPIESKQPPYRLIYALILVELEILKTYIKTHLITGFIPLSKSLATALILFDQKPDGSFGLYVNY